jgi:SAM-dependent methyltransferase
MPLRWTWAPGLDPHGRAALARRFDPSALAPAAVPSHRHLAGRGYGVLAARPDLPFDVFVKTFACDSVGRWLRAVCGLSDAAREFAAAVRLHAMGVRVPRPLALARDAGFGPGRRCFLLMERLAEGRPLAEALREAPAAGAEAVRPLLEAAARTLVTLAAAGVEHRDVRPSNCVVLPAGEAAAPPLALLDARHTAFGADPASALAAMTVTFGAFLVQNGAEPDAVQALVRAVGSEAAARGGAVAAVRTEGLAGEAHRHGADLLAREVRKGRRPPADLDRFAARYATAADAAGYRDCRFGRSRSGRRIDAAERRLVADLVARLGVRGTVLDVPCGTGRFIPVLASAGCPVLAGDVSAEMLAVARRAALEAGAACACVALDARRVPVPDGSVELAMAMRLLHRVREPAERVAVLRELGRASRRWVLFSFYNRRSLRGLRDRLRGRYGGETRAAIRRDLAEAGLTLERFLPVGPLARQTLVLARVAGGDTAPA